MLIAIAAMTDDRVIGRDNKLPRSLPADLARFRAITSGKTVVMGRKTYESIGRLLPKRHNIVISSQLSHLPANTPDTTGEVFTTTGSFLTRYHDHSDQVVYIIGGGQIYSSLLPYCDILDITEVKDHYEGDAYFPEFKDLFHEVAREVHEGYDFVRYEKN